MVETLLSHTSALPQVQWVPEVVFQLVGLLCVLKLLEKLILKYMLGQFLV